MFAERQGRNNNAGPESIVLVFVSRHWLRRICLLLCLATTHVCSASDVLKSSVSPEFPNGLQKKYLTYIAQQLGKDLKLYPMPYARRLVALRKGEIDLMVGLKRSHKTNGEFIYIEPSYEQVRVSLFVLAKNSHRLKTSKDLRSLVIGTTIDDRKHLAAYEAQTFDVVPVTNLQQKIGLLQAQRIDVFIHLHDSAMAAVIEQGLETTIIPAAYQLLPTTEYFIAVSTSSNFIHRIDDIRQIVLDAKQDRVFSKLRANHYEQRLPKTTSPDKSL